MKNKESSLFRVVDGISFIVTTQSSNIDALREASKECEIPLPDARVIIIYSNEELQFYHELAGYGVTEFAFSLAVPELDLPDDFKSRDEIRKYALGIFANNIENMHWGNILKQYLGENGIDYEEC